MPLYLRHRSDKVTDRGVPAVRRILYYGKDKAMFRDKTKKVWIGDVCIGGGSPVTIQSMTNTRTEDVEATVAQILELERAGCQIIRWILEDLSCGFSLNAFLNSVIAFVYCADLRKFTPLL